jgi:hypothetical protein
VELAGAAVCHEGYRSCFFRRLNADGGESVIAERAVAPDEIYGEKKSQ